MNKLPKVFVNKINKPIRHSQIDTLINENNEYTVDLDDILKDNTYSFNHIYKITLYNNIIIQSSIIFKDNKTILTIDGDKIKKSDIKSIVEIKK